MLCSQWSNCRRILLTKHQNAPKWLTSNQWLSTSSLLSADRVLPADSYISWDTKVPVKLRMRERGHGAKEPELVQSVFRDVLAKYPTKKALTIKRNGEWVEWNFTEYHRDVQAVAKGFLALGLSRRAGVGIMGPNTPEWAMSSIGAIFAGGLSCGIYATNSPEMVTYIANKSPLEIFVAHNMAYVERVLAGRSFEEAMPTVKKVILVEGITLLPILTSK